MSLLALGGDLIPHIPLCVRVSSVIRVQSSPRYRKDFSFFFFFPKDFKIVFRVECNQEVEAERPLLVVERALQSPHILQKLLLLFESMKR